MPGRRPKDSVDSNLAAEFFVASQLQRLGHTVMITFGHTKEIDLAVITRQGKTVTIDSKGLKNRRNWPVRVKRVSSSHFFVLVGFNNRIGDLTYQPEAFIVPSTRIRRYLGRWSGGSPDQTAVAYKKMKGSRWEDAWGLLEGSQRGSGPSR